MLNIRISTQLEIHEQCSANWTSIMKFEKLIEDVGAFGPFQRRLFILVSLVETPAAWAMFLPVFIQSQPIFSCNASEYQVVCGNGGEAGCNSSTSNQSATSFCDADGTFCDSAEFQTSSVRVEWDLCSESSQILNIKLTDLITTLQMAGGFVGVFVFGQLADTFGRRRLFYIAYSCMLLFSCLQVLTDSWPTYTTCRVLVGFFFAGTMIINFVLPMEFIGPQWRAFCGCIGFWAVGVMLMALLAYLVQEWRMLALTTSLLGVPLLATYWFVPESPRWLVQKGRLVEAEKILAKIAKYNNKEAPNQRKLILAQEEADESKRQQYTSYWDLFRTPAMAKNTLILMYAWFVSSSVYYAMSFQMGRLLGNKYINFFLGGLVEIPAIILVVICNNRFGRRWTMSCLMFTAALFSLIICSLHFANIKSKSLTYLALVGKFGISGAWASVQVSSAEIFPTVVRNVGVGLSGMSSRVGAVISPLIVALTSYSPALPFVLYGSLSLLASALCLALPETLNKPLPDVPPPWDWPCCPIKHDQDYTTVEICDTTVKTTQDGSVQNASRCGSGDAPEADGDTVHDKLVGETSDL